ncbi:antibiotic biosynthesis monooxygenase family protein [Subtercola frigoramans]|uniref:Heme-degrading monooxygenase HmoA n=1 Tax=Subtercola frigoramans TaxID=120298 RepID=A0ABS2L7M2_9MICO|nr:antibiotic biosynthesis monooxygenase [Subtercola frigoramans]MBM7473100.1 heme-degrading monooxygenase HmoA [Subtercola frigoramans]
MILEVADIRAREGHHDEFEAAVRLGLDTVLSTSPGFVSYELRAGVESPDRYLLMITWNALEDHTVGFRTSPLYEQWSAIVRPHFAEPPSVEHFRLVASSA